MPGRNQIIVGAALLLCAAADRAASAGRRTDSPTADAPTAAPRPVVRAEAALSGHSQIGIDESGPAPETGRRRLTFAELGAWDYDPVRPSDPPETIRAADGSAVTVTGFMYPLEAGRKLRMFCLLRATQTCCYGPRPQYNQYLFVEMKSPVAFERFAPVTVTGRFAVDPRPEEGYIYRLEGESLELAAAEQPAASGKAGEPPAPRRADAAVLATVNGEPILFGQVRAGIPDGLFGSVLENVARARLERLIRNKALDAYLRTHGVQISEKEVDAVVAGMRKKPPALDGCVCCGYGTLQDYLDANFLTLDDLRTEIRNDLGVGRKIEQLWETEYPAGEKRRALLAEHKERLEKSNLKLAHIFFNSMPQSAYDGTPERKRAHARKKMEAVQKKLKKGSSFDEVVRDSEDRTTRDTGGRLGCIPMNFFGSGVEGELRGLAEGTVSDPVESPWGFHIFLREPMTEEDMLAALKSEIALRHTEELRGTVMKNTRIERFGTGRP